MKKYICLFICLVFLCVPLGVSAEQKQTVTVDENEITVKIPDDFTVLTKESLNESADIFDSMPISKNEAIDMFQAQGVVLDAFSEDQTKEIKITVKSDAFSQQIVNLSPLEKDEQEKVLETLTQGLTQTEYTTVLDQSITQHSGYTFLKYTIRIGQPEKGYCCSSMMTIINKKYYEITCYNSDTILTDEHTQENEEVFSSLSLKIKNNSGEMTTNRLTSIFAILAIIAAGLVVISLVYSLIKYAYKKHNEPEHVTLHTRDL